MRLGNYCIQELIEYSKENKSIWLLDGDLADSYGADMYAKHFPDRFIMGGIAEQNLVSMAAGMASYSLSPWVFSFSSFLCFRAYDQIRSSVCQTASNVKLVGSHSGGFTGKNGQSHASLNDIAIMCSLPQMQVWSPSQRDDVIYCIKRLINYSGPAYVRLPREPLEKINTYEDVDDCYWITKPNKIVIVSTGIGVHIALSVKDYLSRLGYEIGIYNCNLIAPFPIDIFRAALIDNSTLFTLEDHYTFGGLGSILQHFNFNVTEKFGWPKTYTGKSGNFNDILFNSDLNPEKIANKILKLIK